MTEDLESLEGFRLRAQVWLQNNMPAAPGGRGDGPRTAAAVLRARELQAKLAAGGFAGITWPTQYGGQGLSEEHQRVFDEVSTEYEMPKFYGSTMRKIAMTLLEHGTEAQKQRHLARILRGEELWAQLLSEPSGGSDLAGAITRATRDGDTWVLNGSKIWTTGAYYADYAMCLARSDWDVPKHQGLSMFIVPLRDPRVTIVPIRQVTGSSDFCQEFLDDVVIPADHLVGDVNDGWKVVRTLLVHERNTFAVTPAGAVMGQVHSLDRQLVAIAERRGQARNPHVRQLLAEVHVNDVVNSQLAKRVNVGQRAGQIPGAAGSLTRLSIAGAYVRRSDIAMEIAGPLAVSWDKDEETSGIGVDYIGRQAYAIGGGTNEIQRNTISERILALPRDVVDDDVPYRDVRTNSLPPYDRMR